MLKIEVLYAQNKYCNWVELYLGKKLICTKLAGKSATPKEVYQDYLEDLAIDRDWPQELAGDE